MTFTSTEIHRIHDGNVKIAYGTYASDGNDEGGTITVRDISYILGVSLQPTADAVETDAPVVNEEFIGQPPRIDKNSFTIVTVANGCGLWITTGV